MVTGRRLRGWNFQKVAGATIWLQNLSSAKLCRLIRTVSHLSNSNPAEPNSNARICAYIMTQTGEGFENASLILPSEASRLPESGDDSALPSPKIVTPSVTASAKFENFDLFDSNIVSLKESKNLHQKSGAPNTAPLALVLSNSKLTPLAMSAERMLAQTPRTSDLRGARLLTLLSLLPFAADAPTKQRYQSAIKDDSNAIAKLDDFVYPI